MGANAATPVAKNVIFFLGDGMGPTTITAARIYKYQEEGFLNMEKLEHSARIKTYSNDAQTTDSAPSMGAYMTGIKINNDVISMADAKPLSPRKDEHGNGSIDRCEAGNGSAATTILELAKAHGKAVGSITTTEMTHATPASTFAHSCHRNAAYSIAAQIVPGGAGYNAALMDGVDVLMGGGRNLFTPYDAQRNPKGRSDGRDLLAELAARGYAVATTKDAMQAARPGRKFIGLYSAESHLSDDHQRRADEPALSQMALKAVNLLAANPNGFFLMVEGGKIDHGLHDSTAKLALTETIAFDDAIKAVLARMRVLDPGLRNTLIVVTADHDHSMVMDGYAKRGNPILDIVRSYSDGKPALDADGKTYTTLMFGTGPNRPDARQDVDSAQAQADGYHQETAIRQSGESHGGGDVKLFATGAGSGAFKGTMENTRVFHLMKAALGF
ncbi:MAG: alkaline phosphatase [Pseudomonadota bacterium]